MYCCFKSDTVIVVESVTNFIILSETELSEIALQAVHHLSITLLPICHRFVYFYCDIFRNPISEVLVSKLSSDILLRNYC